MKTRFIDLRRFKPGVYQGRKNDQRALVRSKGGYCYYTTDGVGQKVLRVRRCKNRTFAKAVGYEPKRAIGPREVKELASRMVVVSDNHKYEPQAIALAASEFKKTAAAVLRRIPRCMPGEVAPIAAHLLTDEDPDIDRLLKLAEVLKAMRSTEKIQTVMRQVKRTRRRGFFAA